MLWKNSCTTLDVEAWEKPPLQDVFNPQYVPMNSGTKQPRTGSLLAVAGAGLAMDRCRLGRIEYDMISKFLDNWIDYEYEYDGRTGFSAK
jgi:hypothetical protein